MVYISGYDDRHPHRDRSWEGRSGSIDRERGYIHPHKEWDNEDYRGGDWSRERRWPMHDPQVNRFDIYFYSKCHYVISRRETI